MDLSLRSQFKFPIEEIAWETDDTFTIRLKRTDFPFNAGQYCLLSSQKDGLKEPHAFSISSSPKDMTLDFTIRIAGEWTKNASKLSKGDYVLIEGPIGDFTIEDGRDLFLIAAGVGIAPVISIIKTYVGSRNIFLLYSIKSEKDMIFRSFIDNIRDSGFSKRIIISSKDGRINKAMIETHLKALTNPKFYICGPLMMKGEIKDTIKEIGFGNDDIAVDY